MQIKLQIVKAFVDNDKGGNPAGVVLDADELSYDQKLAIARKAGYSETAFISASRIADFKFDFFTPSKQIAHCGHATIGAFSYLKQKGLIKGTDSSKETIDGVRRIKLVGELAFMEQTAPVYTDVNHETDIILHSLNITGNDLYPGSAPCIVNTGNSFLLIPLKNKKTLHDLQPDLDKIAAYSKPYNLIGFYPFSVETEQPGRYAGSRMFGPYYGINEESATGMAAGPLACYLYDKAGIKNKEILIEQGNYMQPPSPSLLKVNLELTSVQITGLMVGGKGIVSEERILNV